MKLNLEIELDWIDEESTLDDVVKQQIIDSIVNKIQKKVEEQVEDKINSTIDEITTSKVTEMTENLFNEFINRPITLSDRYGDTIRVYDKLEDLIKERFDNFMEQTVDEKGRTYDGGFGKKYKRINYIIDKQLKDYADKFTTEAVKRVSEEIKEHVKDGLTTKLGSELMKVLKVDKMLKS